MDIETKPKSESEETKEAQLDPRIDPELEYQVRMTTEDDIPFPITLTVKGVVITGTLISGREYFKSLGDIMYKALSNNPTNAEKSRDSYYKYGEELYGEPGTNLDKTQLKYIHLKEAFAFVGLRKIVFGLWRGKLAEVDGFTWGTYDVIEPDKK